MFIISNTIKLTTFDRRDEIAIMKMVGATDGFIRWPFVYEGLLLGLIGAVVAFGLQWLLYAAVSQGIANSDTMQLLRVVDFRQIWPGGGSIRRRGHPGGRGWQPDRHPEIPAGIKREETVMKTKLKQLTALVCAVAMMAALCLALRPVDTAYGAGLNDQLAETRAKKQEIQQQLDKIKSDKAKALEQKELLDQQAAIIAQQIDLLEVQIQDTQDRITQNQAEEEKQYDLFCRQVRQEEERGTVSYWSVLFKATGFADLLSRMDFINEIVEHDQSVIDQLRTLRQQLAQDKADLEQHQAELTASKTELDAQVAEATRVFEEYAASEAGQQALLNQQAAREKELQEEIRKSEEASRNNQTAVGGFIWPTACRLITGGYGGRDAPCPGASTYHLGVDIGASWGSDIYATKAGTVMLANEGWNYGLGYCVKIQHDDGTSTVYGHMSRVIAVTGQRVAQGQVIGKIGSTGVSTGPHLHYEIRIGGVNGTAVNPLPYLPGYVRYGW